MNTGDFDPSVARQSQEHRESRLAINIVFGVIVGLLLVGLGIASTLVSHG